MSSLYINSFSSLCQVWNCPYCPRSGQDLSKTGSFHKQNCFKHYRSASHCKNVTSLSNKGTAVETAVVHNQECVVYNQDLPQAIIDDVIVQCARKSVSFSSVPIVMGCVARALIACRGKVVFPSPDIMKVRTVCPRAATAMVRLNAATEEQTIKGGNTRPACVRGRHYVAERMLVIGKQTIQQKAKFLASCPYLSLSADESDTYSFSAPLAAALQGCSRAFQWANLFMGQVDVSEDKTGEGLFKSLLFFFNKIDPVLFQLIVFSCTDGASAMRSTPKYAGLDSNPHGTSFHAHMKRANKPKLPNIHCVPHNLNLSLKKAITRGSEWSKDWLEHVKCVYKWFSKSPSRKSKLKSLHAKMSLLQSVVTWKMVYPKYYCPTRWIGIKSALQSILAAVTLLESYVDGLVRDGFRPDREKDNLIPDEPDARVEEDSDDDVVSVHKDSFHEWGTERWDLQVPRPVGDVDIVGADERVAMEDTGRASIWSDLPDGTSRANKCRLLSERVGLTSFMIGLDSMMFDVLEPYAILVERLQTQVTPIGHKVRSWVSLFFRDMATMFLSDTPSYGPKFCSWLRREDVNDAMSDQVRAIGRSFSYDFMIDVRRRLQPYWKLILAIETINPCAPASISPSAWEGVRDLVERCMDGVDWKDVVQELKTQHDEAGDWCMAQVTACTSNLLKYYHDRYQTAVNNQQAHKYPLADEFARLVFSLHLTSSIIETYFSKTKYIKNLHRSRLRDSLSSMTLHLQQLRKLRNKYTLQNLDDYDIDLDSALTHLENDLNTLRDRYGGTRVLKPFLDDNTGTVRPYGGTVSEIHWSTQEGCYLFHIEYDSDSDDEDMELWELKRYSE